MAASSTTQTLHYGGSLLRSKNGAFRLSSMPGKGASFKKSKRLELIVRMENAGLPERAIASMLTISVPRLRYIKKSPAYLSTRMQITHGIILDADAQLATIREQRKEILSQMLPPALQALGNVLMSQPQGLADRKLQVAVAQDLLDREGTYPKVSRTEVKPVSFFDFETSDREAHSVLQALKEASSGGSSVESAASDANVVFANSHTLSAIDQEAALAELEATPLSKDALLELEPASEKEQ